MKLSIKNKKAKYDYFLSNSLEVGLKLTSQQLKSIVTSKGANISLKESYVQEYNNEMFLKQCHISGTDDPIAEIKLLMHKREILKYKKLSRDNSTLILYEIYTDENGRLKGTLNLAKGKKSYDKRAQLKEKTIINTIKRK